MKSTAGARASRGFHRVNVERKKHGKGIFRNSRFACRMGQFSGKKWEAIFYPKIIFESEARRLCMLMNTF
jgi:hypothetical protein